MFKKCLQAWASYGELCRENATWMKKHWKGYTAFCVAMIGLPFIYEHAKYKINSKRLLTKEEESQR